ncbi:hypothetical protein DSO57_1033468 [Entomophthora muscae]|uniref:Uncharacterized protein n=1 Tax=Entomophthora muscae TaxID=34485 RepID=A0ACC2TBH5_9FUNG|nr:hypothetical protein DSO57_1033468 [Entomophthora muscae]
MSSQKRKQPSSSNRVASSSGQHTDPSPTTKAGNQVQQRKGLTVKQTSELRKSSNSSMDAPEDILLLEIMCLVGLVASQPLFDLPKGSIKEGTTESCPVNTFGDYYGILDYIKNAKIVPFLIKEEPYIDILMSLASKEGYNSIREALSSGQNVDGEVYNELVSVCQLLSKDVVIGLLDQIEFKKVTCGFSLVQTPGINPDKSKTT